jgi:AcrR family transcriptional regulator
MAECCAAKGYEETTVADVCAAAGVSRESFERIFADKNECLGATMESVVAEAWRALESVRSPDKSWGVTLRDGCVALLGFFADRPACAYVVLFEAPMAAGRAGALAASSRAGLLAYLEEGRKQAELGIPVSAARGALAGVEALIAARLLAGEAERLPELVPDAVYMLAVPFLGVGEAQRLVTGPAGRGHLRAVA